MLLFVFYHRMRYRGEQAEKQRKVVRFKKKTKKQDKNMNEFDEFESTKSRKTDSVKKNIAGFIDGIILIIFYSIFFFLNISYFINLSDTFKMLYIFAIFFIYRLITIMTINRTIGMILIGIKFSKEDGTELNVKEKLLTVVMVYINNVDCFNIK